MLRSLAECHSATQQAASLRYVGRRVVDSFAPARSALAGLWLRPMELPLLPSVSHHQDCRFRDMQTFRRWAPSLPFSRPYGLRCSRILFATSQVAQIPSGSSPLISLLGSRCLSSNFEVFRAFSGWLGGDHKICNVIFPGIRRNCSIKADIRQQWTAVNDAKGSIGGRAGSACVRLRALDLKQGSIQP